MAHGNGDNRPAAPRPVALVTGARGGIGRAIAVGLADEGFDVALTDLVVDGALKQTADLASEKGVRAECFALDIAQIDELPESVAAIEAETGPLSCLVNNAGVSVKSRGDLLDVSPDSFDRCIGVNLRGTFFLTQAVARRMLDGPAGVGFRSIVTVTSSNVEAVSIARGEYCVSKAGLSMASRLFAVRLAEAGIGVFEIRPGIIATEMTATVAVRYDEAIANGLTAIPRWGTPGDVAAVAGAMATGRLPYTVGQAITVDGGLLIPRF